MEKILSADFAKELKEMYLYLKKEIDLNRPEGLVDKMVITVFVNFDHVHNKGSRRSMTDIVVFLAQTLVFCMSKIYVTIECLAYPEELMAM